MTKPYEDTSQSIESAFATEIFECARRIMDQVVLVEKPKIAAIIDKYAAKGMSRKDLRRIALREKDNASILLRKSRKASALN